MTNTFPVPIDVAFLKRELDKVKTSAFQGSNAAFFGSIVSNLNFSWSEKYKTAATDGVNVFWNKEFFLNSSKKLRKATLIHEVNHVARMHAIRIGNRDPKLWTKACDIRINNDMLKEYDTRTKLPRYEFEGFNPWHFPEMDRPKILSEEEIYEVLVKDSQQEFPKYGGKDPWDNDEDGDLLPAADNKQQAINIVMQAIVQAKYLNKADEIPGGIESFIDNFLKPIIPWERVLKKFFTDMLDEDTTWKRPNRRHDSIYLPSRFLDSGALDHLAYYLDVSGSITQEQVRRFNSELKFIQEELKPQKLTAVQFDSRITDVREFDSGDPFQNIKVIGGGGTCWNPVKEDIEKREPTCAVIFTDMEFFDRVVPLSKPIPVIWIVLGNSKASIPFGTVTHIS